MRKILSKIIPTLIFMIMLMVTVTPAARAAEVKTGDFEVEVRLLGPQPSPPEKFTIIITPQGDNNILPATGNKFVVGGGDAVEFPEITFSNIGIYNYEVQQKGGTISGAVYDNSTYYLKVTVTNRVQGGLEITKSLRKNDENAPKVDKMIFTNRYPTPPPPPSPATPAKVKLKSLKTLDNENPINQKFNFLLTDENGTVLQTTSNEAQNIEFDEIEYNSVGAYIYYIREKIEVDGKYTYDDAVYEVIVRVSRNNSGDYEATTSYLVNGTPFTRVPIFANLTKVLPETGGEDPEPGEKPEPEPGIEIPETEPGKLPDTGGKDPEPGKLPNTGDNKPRPELPKTGEAKSALPIVGLILILGGVSLSLRRKAVK